MSAHHQVSLVQVNAFREEEVELSQVLGYVPVQQLVQVLNSTWARSTGWVCQADGKLYSLNLRNNVRMQVSIDELDGITIRRDLSGIVESSQAAAHSQLLEQRISEAEPEYNLRFNEIVGRSLMRALPQYAEQFGEIVATQEHFDDEAYVYDMEIKIYVSEAA